MLRWHRLSLPRRLWVLLLIVSILVAAHVLLHWWLPVGRRRNRSFVSLWSMSHKRICRVWIAERVRLAGRCSLGHG